MPQAGGSVLSLNMSGEDDSPDGSPMEPASPSDSIRSSDANAVKEEADDGSDVPSAQAERSGMPMQKRRRVSRACDECRRKKIKCDGKQPCTHCAVYSYECTYDKPSNRRRNPAPQYIEALEAKLQRAETLLRKFMPDVDLNDPSLDPVVQHEFRSRERARAQKLQAIQQAPAPVAAKGSEAPSMDTDEQDVQILSMIETIGQLDLSDAGEWNFHGISSSAVFLRKMKEHFRGMLGNDYRIPFLPRPPRPQGMFSLDSPRSNSSSNWDTSGLPNIYDLPPKETAKMLCDRSLTCATCLLRIVHIPTFYEMLDRIYDIPVDAWGNEENRFLALLYSVMALGSMYVFPDKSGTPVTYKTSLEEGLKYYGSARLLLQDVAECRDMTSLQALLFMILFLQASSNLSGCYAFIGIALRSCLRMGLHRHLPHASINPVQDEIRRRVFHVVRQMDIYVSAILGFPMLMSDDDIDQPLPTEVDDEYITNETVRTPPPNTPSFFQAFNAHARLMKILARVVKQIYPLKGVEECAMNGERAFATYLISFARIKEIEEALQEWYEQLPQYWRPSSDGPSEVVRVRTLLRFVYAHVQMILYRPFLHYVSPRLTAGKHIDERYYACAAAGISVSRNIVHIGSEIKKQSSLIGPYWFILYTEFFAIISLVFYVIENVEKPGSQEILKDARDGREFLASLAQMSVAAERVTNALNGLFEQLPDRLKKGKAQARPIPTKKRTLPGSKGGEAVAAAASTSLPESVIPRRTSGETSRPPTGIAGSDGGALRLPHRSSFGAQGGVQRGGLPNHGLQPNLQDLLPVDTQQPHGFHHSQASGATSANALYKLDQMMFPSEDPFAYPNQPTAPGSMTQRRAQSVAGAQPPHGGGSRQQQHQDGMPFYMPNVYDDIEGQLLGPIPSYLVPQGQGHGLPGVDFAGQMFGQPAHPHGAHLQQQVPGQGRGHAQQQQQQQQEQLSQQQQRDIDELLSDPNFRHEWGDILGANPAGYRQM